MRKRRMFRTTTETMLLSSYSHHNVPFPVRHRALTSKSQRSRTNKPEAGWQKTHPPTNFPAVCSTSSSLPFMVRKAGCSPIVNM